MRKLLTIGHSTLGFDEFVARLRANEVDSVVDVRSVPFSRYTPQFNANELRHVLRLHNIAYLPMGSEFGARPSSPALYLTAGRVNFEAIAASELFMSGLIRVEQGMDKGYRPALMCTEKDPIDCHRTILVARAFATRGTCVTHILADGALEKHADFERRLLDMYFPNRGQLSLWDSTPSDTAILLQEAYKMRGQEIAYEVTANAIGGEN